MSTNPVRTAVEKHSDRLQHVSIDEDAVQSLAANHAGNSFELPQWDAPVFPDRGDWSFDRTVDYFVVGNALNFCFNDVETGEKFEAERMNMTFDGAFGMWLCLYDETVNGARDMTDPETLQSLSAEDVRAIFEPSNGVQLPLIEQRLSFLHEIGNFLEDVESVGEVVRLSDGSLFGDRGVVSTLVQRTDAYGSDKRTLEAAEIPFNKRAQLAAIMLHGYYQNSSRFAMNDIDALTLPSDYGVPNTLRGFDVLSYDEALQDTVDSRTRLPENGREEVEIRVASVLATDRLLDAINQRRENQISIPQLDYFLWSLRRESPHHEHLTQTTAY